MAKAKAAVVTYDDIQDKISNARAIADAIGSLDKECSIDHESLWRLGHLMNNELVQASSMLEKYDEAQP